MTATPRLAAIAAFTLLTVFSSLALAQQKPAGLPGNYPAKPVRVIIGNAPGGGTDFVGRAVFGKLGEHWGAIFNVENIGSGIGGGVAMDVALKAPADGYTLLVTSGGNYLNAAFTNTGSYDVRKVFVPIAQFTVAPLLVAMHPGQPYSNLREMIAYAKSRPGEISYGVAGIGSSTHLSGELLQHMAGFKMVAVPYKGSGQSVVDAIAGRIQIVIGSTAAMLPHIKSGKLKSLGVTSASRLPSAPDQQTIAEAGVPGFEYVGWFGAVGRTGIPQSIITALNQDIQRVVNLPESQRALLASGSDANTGSQDQFRAVIQSGLEKTDLVLKATGIKLGD